MVIFHRETELRQGREFTGEKLAGVVRKSCCPQEQRWKLCSTKNCDLPPPNSRSGISRAIEIKKCGPAEPVLYTVISMVEKWVRVTEAVALTLFFLLIVALIRSLIIKRTGIWIPVSGAILGWLVADLVSGLVHWFCDSFFREDSLLVGRLLIRPFREHHRNPLGMTRHCFLELMGNSCLAMIPTLAAAVWWSDGIAPLFETAALFFYLALFATNLFHKWAHASVVPRPVRWLQSRWLILPPSCHQVHHQNGYTGAYCITNGWMNWPLDRLLRVR